MRIQRIRIKNFRCLTDVDLELRPFTVLIGPNGAGKSSLFEMVHALSVIRREPLQNAMARWGGFDYALWYHAAESDRVMEIGVKLGDDVESMDYQLRLRGERGAYYVENEYLIRKEPASITPRTLISRKDTEWAWFSSNQQEQRAKGAHGPGPVLTTDLGPIAHCLAFMAELERTSLWQIHRFQLNARTKGAQVLQPTKLPLPDGSDLLSALYTMMTERKTLFLELLDTLRAAIPELDELSFPLVGAGNVTLKWEQKNLPKELYLSQLSDGILRFLWLMTILHAVPDDALVMIDEPEISLHPQWILLAVSAMRKMSVRANIMVATQSPEVLRWVQPEELLIADVDENGTRFSWADKKPDLAKWIKDFTLAELWTMGVLGGGR